MNKRGVIILSTLFGLFALTFGVLGVRALTLGPDPARPDQAQLAARTLAANQLEKKIAMARANTPPALPAVPDRVQVSASTPGASNSGATSNGVAAATPVQATPPTTQARGGEYYDEGEEYGDDGNDYESARGDDRGYGGDDEDD